MFGPGSLRFPSLRPIFVRPTKIPPLFQLKLSVPSLDLSVFGQASEFDHRDGLVAMAPSNSSRSSDCGESSSGRGWDPALEEVLAEVRDVFELANEMAGKWNEEYARTWHEADKLGHCEERCRGSQDCVLRDVRLTAARARDRHRTALRFASLLMSFTVQGAHSLGPNLHQLKHLLRELLRGNNIPGSDFFSQESRSCPVRRLWLTLQVLPVPELPLPSIPSLFAEENMPDSKAGGVLAAVTRFDGPCLCRGKRKRGLGLDAEPPAAKISSPR